MKQAIFKIYEVHIFTHSIKHENGLFILKMVNNIEKVITRVECGALERADWSRIKWFFTDIMKL